MALYRGSPASEARARLATVIAVSALRRGDRHLTACALAHAHGAPGAATVGVLFQQHASPEVVEHELNHSDLYRFNADGSHRIGIPSTRVCDSRTRSSCSPSAATSATPELLPVRKC